MGILITSKMHKRDSLYTSIFTSSNAWTDSAMRHRISKLSFPCKGEAAPAFSLKYNDKVTKIVIFCSLTCCALLFSDLCQKTMNVNHFMAETPSFMVTVKIIFYVELRLQPENFIYNTNPYHKMKQINKHVSRPDQK